MQLKNVGKSFGNQAILEDIQLNISPSNSPPLLDQMVLENQRCFLL